MTDPRRYLYRMLLFLVAVLAVVLGLFAASPVLVNAFMANPALNGVILGVALLGVGYVLRQVLLLRHEVTWIQSYVTGRPGRSVQIQPRLLAPMVAMLGERRERVSLSAMSMRTLLDGVSSRLDESRDISRYLIGLLIFLGLLGTFWGLLQTITAVGAVIGDLTVEAGDLATVFGELRAGLEAPLAGMGTAFSSSLFGLAGSLALGFLDLQVGQAQNRFYNDLEDWLSGRTRLAGGGLGEGVADQSVPAYVQALLEQTADSLEQLQRTLERGEESRIHANQSVVSLTEKLGMLTDQMRTEQNLMMRLAENQMELKPILSRLADQSGGYGFDDGVRGHIRNLDLHMARLLEELAQGRAETVQELRTEIRVLSRTIAAIAEQQSPR